MEGGIETAADGGDADDASAVEGGADAGAEGGMDDAERLAGELERVRSELSALNERHLRLAAEFDNYRKRTERERTETWSRAQAEIAAGLLEVVDDFERVAGTELETSSAESLLEGIQLIARKMRRSLESLGLEEVEAEGEVFDPASMEALMTIEAEEPEQDDEVALVLQKGYRFKGQLLRPARVQVRKYQGG